MFCQQCGNTIPDNSSFCSNCGAPVAQAAPVAAAAAPDMQQTPVYNQQGYPQQPYYPAAPAQPSAASKAFKSFVSILKGMFSMDIVKTVGTQAKNTGREWIIGMILSVLAFALATPVNILEGIAQLIREVSGGLGDMILKYIQFPFFSFFGASLLIGIVVLAAVTAGLWLVAKMVSKKDVPFTCALNLVATATLPLSICYVANMLLGLIWAPLAMAVSIIALIMTLILLYVGLQKLEKPTVSPFYPYAALTAVVVIVAVLLGFLLYKAVITGWIGNIAGNALGGLGGLGGLGDLFG